MSSTLVPSYSSHQESSSTSSSSSSSLSSLSSSSTSKQKMFIFCKRKRVYWAIVITFFILLLVINLIITFGKLSSVHRFIKDYDYNINEQLLSSLFPLPPPPPPPRPLPSPFHSSSLLPPLHPSHYSHHSSQQELMITRLAQINNDSSLSYPLEISSGEVVGEGEGGEPPPKLIEREVLGVIWNEQQQQQQQHDDYCHPIRNKTKIINNANLRPKYFPFRGCPTSYPLSDMIHYKNLKPLAKWMLKMKQDEFANSTTTTRNTTITSHRDDDDDDDEEGSDGSDGSDRRKHRRRKRRHTTRAICQFRAVEDYWYEMPHAMQQLYACFSFWMSHVEAYNKNNTNTNYYKNYYPTTVRTNDYGNEKDNKVVILKDDVKKHGGYVDHNNDEKENENKEDVNLLKLILMWDEKRRPIDLRYGSNVTMNLQFVNGILEIFQNVFHVELYHDTYRMHYAYYPNYQNYYNNETTTTTTTTEINDFDDYDDTVTDIYVTTEFSVKIASGRKSGYKMLNSYHAELLREMTTNYYPHIFNSTLSLSTSAATATATAASSGATAITTAPSINNPDTVTSTNKTRISDVVTGAGCPHRGVNKNHYENQDENHHPVIGILNRARGPILGLRTIDNVHHLHETLQEKFSSSAIIRPIQYFEHTTIWDQLSWFHNVDIVISPHGAQLTGIPFVPKCGGLLEYFPSHYYLPYYFGSLASISGLHYIHMYLGQDLISEWFDGAKYDLDWQADARTNTSLCVPIPETIKAVQILIDNWHDCCNKQQY